MGLNLLSFIKNKVSKEQKIAFISTFLIALLVHIYKFTNTLPNHDSLVNYYDSQNILGSGRWALSIACGFTSYFDLPWVIGAVSCLFIALTVVVMVTLFKVKNPVIIVLFGGLLTTSLATTETFFFLFTADGYMIAMFLAAVAVYLSRIDEHRVWRWVISGICICISCGIYQAYVSFALILAICYFMYELLQDNHKKKDCYIWIGRQACIFACSLAAYFIIWKLCMHISGITANSYQGIAEVGKISFSLIPNGIVSAIESFAMYFLQWNVVAHGWTLYSVLNITFLLVFLIGLIIAIKESKIFARRWAFFLVLICCIAIVPFACIWHFVSGFVDYRAMMLQSLTILFAFTALLFEHWAKKYLKSIVGLFLLVIILNNALMANISYFYMNLSYEQTYADGLKMVMEIHDMQNQYEFEKIAVIGDRFVEVQLDMFDENGKVSPAGKIHLLSRLIENNMLYDQKRTVSFLRNTYGLELASVSEEEQELLAQTEMVTNMPCWPANGSMCVMDGTLVIKLANSK